MEAGTADRLGTTSRGTTPTNGTLDRVRSIHDRDEASLQDHRVLGVCRRRRRDSRQRRRDQGWRTPAGTDEFIANEAWLYVSIVTGAYLISRGLAKAGTSDPYTEDRSDRS